MSGNLGRVVHEGMSKGGNSMSDYNAFAGWLYVCCRCGEKKALQEMATEGICEKCLLQEEYET